MRHIGAWRPWPSSDTPAPAPPTKICRFRKRRCGTPGVTLSAPKSDLAPLHKAGTNCGRSSNSYAKAMCWWSSELTDWLVPLATSRISSGPWRAAGHRLRQRNSRSIQARPPASVSPICLVSSANWRRIFVASTSSKIWRLQGRQASIDVARLREMNAMGMGASAGHSKSIGRACIVCWTEASETVSWAVSARQSAGWGVWRNSIFSWNVTSPFLFWRFGKSRNAIGLTARLSAIAAAAGRIKAESFTIDGEAVVLRPRRLVEIRRAAPSWDRAWPRMALRCSSTLAGLVSRASCRSGSTAAVRQAWRDGRTDWSGYAP